MTEAETCAELERAPTCQPTFERDQRRAVALGGFGALRDGTTFPLSVVDLSYDGCKIASTLAVLPGVELKISILGLGGAIEAAVRWRKDGHAGLKFKARAVEGKPERPRKYPRIELAAELSLRRMGRQQYHTRLFDLTPTGCRVEFVERPRRGEMLWAKFEGLDSIEATVRWIDGFYGGLEFIRPIHPAVFELLLARIS